MQKELARRLLSATLNWSDEDIELYLDKISNFAELKYDEYQQYRPGSRFLEKLSEWLSQFDEGKDRETAIHFVLDKMVFISASEMYRLIEAVYPTRILPILLEEAHGLSFSNAQENSDIIRLLKTQSLFFAMSDGARIDILRRSAFLEHDQVSVDYNVSTDKFTEMISEMKKRAKTISANDPAVQEVPLGIHHVFLLDDFSGSGISYLREEGQNYKGKIKKVIDHLNSTIQSYNEKNSDTISRNGIKIHIVLYLATKKAVDRIRKLLTQISDSLGDYAIDIDCVQYVEPTKLSKEEESLFEKHYNSVKDAVEDSHYKKGSTSKPYYGFDGCGLSLVIYHNTPNNSFPILWAGEHALFPRVTRHKDVR